MLQHIDKPLVGADAFDGSSISGYEFAIAFGENETFYRTGG